MTRRRGRGRAGGGVSLVEGQGGVNPTILGGSIDHLAHFRHLAAATNLQLFPNTFRHFPAMGTRDIHKLTSGATHARLQHITP